MARVGPTTAEEQAPETPDYAGTSPVDAPGGFQLVTLLSVILRYRRQILLSTAASGALFVVVAAIQPRTFTSSASFVSEGDKGSSGAFAAIGSQLGISIPVAGGGKSPAFYADLVRSRAILTRVVESRYRVPGGDEAGVSLVALDGGTGALAVRRDKAIARLRTKMNASVSPKTGVVTVTLQSKSATLAHSIATRLLEEVNRFNLQTRQSQATARRKFAEGRLEDIAGELRAAENRLQEFLQGNRDSQGSPSLAFTKDRLAREVFSKQRLHDIMAQAFEEARIEEVRDTPVITILEPPVLPSAPDSRRFPLRAAVGLTVGLVAGIFFAAARNFAAKSSRWDTPEYREFTHLRQTTLQALKRS